MWHVRGHKRDRVPGYAHAGLAFRRKYDNDSCML
jgi:hypothetical protein